MSIHNRIKRYRVKFHQIRNSSFSYCMDLIMLNDTNIAKAINITKVIYISVSLLIMIIDY
jgi:hypothetical protein